MTTHTTPDLYFASAIMSLGAHLEGKERKGAKVVFTFSGVDPKWEMAWVNGSLMTNARAFANAIQALKALIHQQ